MYFWICVKLIPGKLIFEPVPGMLALIIGLILLGIVLLVLEIIVLPGFVSGVLGIVMMIAGIIMMYGNFGSVYGTITLFTTVIAAITAVFLSLKSRSWNRFGLKDIIAGRMNEVSLMGIAVGDKGITVSALRPSGSVMIGDKKVEAQTTGEMLPPDANIVIVKVLPNKVIVKPVSSN